MGSHGSCPKNVVKPFCMWAVHANKEGDELGAQGALLEVVDCSRAATTKSIPFWFGIQTSKLTSATINITYSTQVGLKPTIPNCILKL